MKKSIAVKALEADVPTGTKVTRVFFYICRGQKVPALNYVPLVAEDLVENRGWSDERALSESILKKLGAAVAVHFIEPTDSSQNDLLLVNTTQQVEANAPSLITPTEEQQSQLQQSPPRTFGSFVESVQELTARLCNSSIAQTQQLPQQRTVHSPPVRSPGFSPPLRRVRRLNASSPRQIDLEDKDEDEIVVETVDEDEEKKEEEGSVEEPPAQLVRPTIAQEKEASRQLDFDLRDAFGLRPPRNSSSKAIHLTNAKQATSLMRTRIVWLAEQWGYNTAHLQREKLLIAELASRVVFYDCGYAKAPKGRMVASWVRDLEAARYNSNNIDFGSVLANEEHARQAPYWNQIETAHPGYLHELYRKACRNPKITYRATFPEIADEMNRLSIDDRLSRPRLYLTRHHIKAWFNSNGGKVRKGWERPILTPERMKARVEWCKKRKQELEEAKTSNEPVYYCFLDEKWFYIRSRRKKLKVLPLGDHEAADAADIPIERESSRRHATKVMYLAVIANPEAEHQFDGKIYLHRVSRMKEIQRATYTENILDDLSENTALQHQWHGYITRGQNATEMIDFVAGTVFDLDEDIKQRLVIRYKDHHDNTNEVKWKTFKSFRTNPTIKPKPNWERRPLDIRDLILQAHFKKGDEVPEDVSCDSDFMKEHMDSIGKAIRDKYHWVPPEKEIFLVMDNAGGHGTRDTIDEYVAGLLEVHNVRVLWQEPRGPELNLLDLGAWVSLQSAVEKYFRGNRNNAEVLARKIEEVWHTFDATVFSKVWNRWVLALDLIIADEGNNRLVNEHRGKLFTPAAPAPSDDEALPPAEDYDVSAGNDAPDEGEGDAFVQL